MRPYEECIVHGPYERKDGRSHVVIIFPDGKRKTVSYPRYLVEIELGYYTKKTDDIHHIDGNYKNNALSNLRVWNKSDHVKSHRRKK